MLNLVSKILRAIILLLTVILRFYNLDVTPAGLTNDEVNPTYNSYAIAKTGHDLAAQP